mmetsp:Transcript_113919/g.309523  ORF Transcript_113919/g.309523 Transcript_113919/m.309523 type:complete len:412 (+) Transcript_113919:266-1501(+)
MNTTRHEDSTGTASSFSFRPPRQSTLSPRSSFASAASNCAANFTSAAALPAFFASRAPCMDRTMRAWTVSRTASTLRAKSAASADPGSEAVSPPNLLQEGPMSSRPRRSSVGFMLDSFASSASTLASRCPAATRATMAWKPAVARSRALDFAKAACASSASRPRASRVFIASAEPAFFVADSLSFSPNFVTTSRTMSSKSPTARAFAHCGSSFRSPAMTFRGSKRGSEPASLEASCRSCWTTGATACTLSSLGRRRASPPPALPRASAISSAVEAAPKTSFAATPAISAASRAPSSDPTTCSSRRWLASGQPGSWQASRAAARCSCSRGHRSGDSAARRSAQAACASTRGPRSRLYSLGLSLDAAGSSSASTSDSDSSFSSAFNPLRAASIFFATAQSSSMASASPSFPPR